MTACQRWREGHHSWRHVSEGGFDRSRYEVAPLEDAAARAFVLRHHYSHSYPAATARFGLYCAEVLVGVAVLSVPANTKALTGVFPGLVPFSEAIELGRFVLLDEVPGNGESFFLTQAFRLAANAGVRGVVSFSDPQPRRAAGGTLVIPGHIGTIYQATNATYLGRGTARSLRLLPDGSVLNARSIQKVRAQERGHAAVEEQLVSLGAVTRARNESPTVWLGRALTDVGSTCVRHGGNHRYAFVLGTPAARRRVSIGMASGPYPKIIDQELQAA